jgi:RimJ/RimL family protein N-acetyltransferase
MTTMKLPEQIETQRLILRIPHVDDASAMFTGWAQDVEVTRYLTWRPHTSLEQSQAIIANAISVWKDEARFPYMITLKESSRVIGMIDPRVEGPKVGVGYVIGRMHWGNGYMPEATRAIIEWAFQQPTIYRVYATTDVENVASQRVLEKVGMQREGLLKKYIVHPNISDIPRDSYMYAITK